MSKVTLHFVWGQLTRKQTVVVLFVPTVSFWNHQIEASHWLKEEFWPIRKWFLELTLGTKQTKPRARAQKTIPDYDAFSWVPFCLRSVVRFERCDGDQVSIWIFEFLAGRLRLHFVLSKYRVSECKVVKRIKTHFKKNSLRPKMSVGENEIFALPHLLWLWVQLCVFNSGREAV